jgi:glucoamylase
MSPDEFKLAYPYLYDPSLSSDSVIKSDLEYISHHWQDLSFDPWEESYAYGHYFNIIAMREALAVGIELSQKLDDPGAADWYQIHLDEMSNYLQEFWSPEEGFIKSTLDHQRGVEWKTKNLDTAVMIATLLANATTPKDISSLSAPPKKNN